MSPPEMVVQRIAPSALAAHPDQERIYGAAGGAHDPTFGDFVIGVRDAGVLVPLIAARETPGLPDGTIISGHRRHAAAAQLGLDVPVIYERFASADHARRALLEHNRQRVKDQWVVSQEAAAWWDVEANLAAARKREHGDTAPGRSRITGGNRSTSDRGKTRDRVGERLGESGKTAEVRVALVDAARAQNPENPADSPIARDLKADKPVRAVARAHGVEVKGRAAKSAPPLDADGFARALGALRAARSHTELGAAYGLVRSVDGLTPERAEELAAAYKQRGAELAAAAPVSLAPRREVESFVSACAQLEQRVRTIAGAEPLAGLTDAERVRCVEAINRVLALLTERRDVLAAEGSAA